MTQYMPSQTKSDVHITPDRVFDLIKEYWGYERHDMFDPCPVNQQFDGLKTTWQKLNYVNPPYMKLKEFVAEAISQALKHNHETIMLLPAKTDQSWFHILIKNKYEIRWIEKRLRFKNNRWSAPQPHFLVRIR